jgi:hypothetical protein
MESGIRESRAVLVRQRQGRSTIVKQVLLKRKETQITTDENPEIFFTRKMWRNTDNEQHLDFKALLCTGKVCIYISVYCT